MITGPQTAFLHGRCSHSSAELPTTESVKDSHLRTAIFKENLSSFGIVLSLLKIEVLLSTVLVEIWDTNLYPNSLTPFMSPSP